MASINEISEAIETIKKSLNDFTCEPLINEKYDNGVRGYPPQFINR